MKSAKTQKAQDEHFMHLALQQAQKALERDEVPIGAVVVSPEGQILGRGYNKVEQTKQQRAHAEMIAIEKAAKKWGDWRLEGCWLYVTLEPCSMCMGLARLSRLEGVVFGADSKLYGYRLDKDRNLPLYNKVIAQIRSGVCAEQSVQLLQGFFKQKRKKGE